MIKKDLISNKYKKIFFNKINLIIENKLFRPLAIAIIVLFTFIKTFQYFGFVWSNYSDKSKNSSREKIKISLDSKSFKYDFNEEEILDYKVKNNDTLLKILNDIGTQESDIFPIIEAIKKTKSSLKLYVGAQIIFTFRSIDKDENDNQDTQQKIIISNITIPQSIEENIVITRKNNGEYNGREVKVKLLRYNSRYFGVIKNGIYVDGVEAGISENAMMNMITLYGYDVDFQRDIHSGDKFEMLVESFYDENGKKVRDGNVIFSSLTLRNRKIEIYMHKINDGDKSRIEYFDSRGHSIKKSLLRTPINGARVSSGYGMRRHPILGYSKMHKGVDFAASKGTPILAAGNGTVVYMSRKGGYGNYVQIKHNSDYTTAYGHVSRFNKRFRVGSKIKQGEIVAYVGSTGRSTGPHLHFELLYKGSQVNPSKVKATSGIKLVGKELVRFENSKNEIDKYRTNTPNQFRKIVNE